MSSTDSLPLRSPAVPLRCAAAQTPEPRRSAAWAVQAAAALVAAALYVAAVRNGYALDDVLIVQRDPLLHDLWSLPRLLLSPYWRSTGELYRPLTTAALALDWQLGGGAPWWPHAVNVLWHALASALVARLALRWMRPAGALVAGLVFAAQPVHVEAVANVIGRAELQCAVALLGVALLATRGTPAGPRRRVAILILSAAAFGSKEIGIAAPVIAWAGASLIQRDKRGEPRSLALAAAAGLAPVLALRWLVLGRLGTAMPHAAFATLSPWGSLELALATLPNAASLLLLPRLPIPDRSPPLALVLDPPLLAQLVGVALIVGMAVALIRHAVRPAPVTFALLFAGSTAFPVANIIARTGVVLAERTLYSASAGAALLLGLGAGILWERRHRMIVAALAIAWLGVGAWRTVATVPGWRSTESVVAMMVARGPWSYWAHYSLARTLSTAGDRPGASREFADALRLFDRDPALLTDAAAEALRAGDATTAAGYLARAVRVSPEAQRPRALLVALRMRAGDSVSARALLAEGLRLDTAQRRWRAMLGPPGGVPPPGR